MARIRAAATAMLEREKRVSVLDVLMGIGWLAPSAFDRWRYGQTVTVIETMQVSPERVQLALTLLRRWAEAEGLTMREATYFARSRERQPLRVSATDDPAVERAYRSEWLAKGLTASAMKRIVEKADAPDETVVIEKGSDWKCQQCATEGQRFFVMQNPGPTCLACMGIADLGFLAAGNAQLTRIAKKKSARYAVVVKFSRARKRYERQGLLLEPSAIRAAKRELGE
jgi:hypothetical protein